MKGFDMPPLPPGFPKSHDEWFKKLWGQFSSRDRTTLELINEPDGIRLAVDGERPTAIHTAELMLMVTLFWGNDTHPVITPKVDAVRSAIMQLLGAAMAEDAFNAHVTN